MRRGGRGREARAGERRDPVVEVGFEQKAEVVEPDFRGIGAQLHQPPTATVAKKECRGYRRNNTLQMASRGQGPLTDCNAMGHSRFWNVTYLTAYFCKPQASVTTTKANNRHPYQ
jgi:hypothetical protein